MIDLTCFIYGFFSFFLELIASIIGLLVSVIPSTPENLKLGYLLQSLAALFPGLGWGIVFEIFQGIVGILMIVVLLKAIKLIPFF